MKGNLKRKRRILFETKSLTFKGPKKTRSLCRADQKSKDNQKSFELNIQVKLVSFYF